MVKQAGQSLAGSRTTVRDSGLGFIDISRFPELSYTGKDPVWEIDTDDLGPSLQYVQDQPTHGVVGPKRPMTLAELEQALAATRAQWVRVIG